MEQCRITFPCSWVEHRGVLYYLCSPPIIFCVCGFDALSQYMNLEQGSWPHIKRNTLFSQSSRPRIGCRNDIFGSDRIQSAMSVFSFQRSSAFLPESNLKKMTCISKSWVMDLLQRLHEGIPVYGCSLHYPPSTVTVIHSVSTSSVSTLAVLW